ncbi:uncharacterized protein LOC105840165 isoform X1 [Monomorium pharaonis]|uniref:uncharacterized protein LOC105840165 isoform X1 n=1 Tax=Monomorium pharaonis TaxID=307658 RepID=UPI00063FB592|nr:uncharacterized protein LOC105840165 isoform X1 [Monomorium pharaonis]
MTKDLLSITNGYFTEDSRPLAREQPVPLSTLILKLFARVVCKIKAIVDDNLDLCNPDSYRSICDRFNIGKATAVRSVRRVMNALTSIREFDIKWPTEEEAMVSSRIFQEMKGFPGVYTGSNCWDTCKNRCSKKKKS